MTDQEDAAAQGGHLRSHVYSPMGTAHILAQTRQGKRQVYLERASSRIRGEGRFLSASSATPPGYRTSQSSRRWRPLRRRGTGRRSPGATQPAYFPAPLGSVLSRRVGFLSHLGSDDDGEHSRQEASRSRLRDPRDGDVRHRHGLVKRGPSACRRWLLEGSIPGNPRQPDRPWLDDPS